MSEASDALNALLDQYEATTDPATRSALRGQIEQQATAIREAQAQQTGAAWAEVDQMGGIERFGRGAWHGVRDFGSGVRQLWNWATGDDEELMEVTQRMQERDRADSALLSTGSGKFGRFAGELAPALLPVGGLAAVGGRALAPAAMRALGRHSLAGRVLGGAAGGAVGGAAAPVETAANVGDYQSQMQLNTGVGAAIGAGLPLALAGGSTLARTVADDMRGPGDDIFRERGGGYLQRALDDQNRVLDSNSTQPGALLSDYHEFGDITQPLRLGGPDTAARGDRVGGRAAGALEVDDVITRNHGGSLIDEFDVYLTPARREYVESGSTRRLAAERAARRMPDTKVEARVTSDLARTRETFEEALSDLPGAGGMAASDSARLVDTILDEATQRKTAADEAWALFRATPENIYTPQQAQLVYQDLLETLQRQLPPMSNPTIGELVENLQQRIGMNAGLDSAGVDDLRKYLRNLGAVGSQEGVHVGAVHRRLMEVLDATRGDSDALNNMRDAVRKSAHDLGFRRGDEYGKLSGKTVSTAVADLVRLAESGKVTPDQIVNKLLNMRGGDAARLLREARDQLGDTYADDFRDIIRKGLFDRILRGPTRVDGGHRMMTAGAHDENYKRVADTIRKGLSENRELLKEVLTPAELAKWERFSRLSADLATPQQYDNWSGTAGTAEWFGRLSRPLPGMNALIDGLLDNARSRNVGRLAYGEDW